MAQDVLTRSEFVEELGIEEATLTDWELHGLVRHPGVVGEAPFYTPENLDQARQILQLTGLGYEIADIQKIVRKVGLPGKDGKKNRKNGGQELITVGELAKRASLNPRTIKYWEEKGIIQPDGRSTGGFRLYTTEYVYLCQLIQDFQRFGYSLEEIKETAELFRDFVAIRNGFSSLSLQETLARFELMDEKITQLRERMNMFKEGIQRWENLLKKHKRSMNQLKNQARTKLEKE